MIARFSRRRHFAVMEPILLLIVEGQCSARIAPRSEIVEFSFDLLGPSPGSMGKQREVGGGFVRFLRVEV